MVENTQKAITLLQIAQDLIAEQASFEEPGADRVDMLTCADDLGPIMRTLESFKQGLKRKRAGEPV